MGEMKEKKVLLVVSERGYTWDEVIYPYLEFQKRHWQVVFATPTGGIPNVDPLSVEVRLFWNLFGFGTSKKVAPNSEKGKEMLAILRKPLDLRKARAADYDAIFVAGGHGALFDLNKNIDLHRLILEFDNARKPVGLLCHASSVLAFMQKDGKPYLHDRRITGFPTAWEHFVLKTGRVYKDFLPMPIWTGREIDKAATRRSWFDRIMEVLNPWYTIQDKNLITGVGPKTGSRLARIVAEYN
ncbi:MAG: ThiJ/PfpI protein [uncultured bacterium]|nr:MAG: ThiJ/PfpI protein [uncultured bacterium]OGH14526.1 MAG: hypothetical protein A2687_05705 [Candidatus Levybacteria bacterium RIFCSPHIGHO2_01_FULL_38_26]